MLPPELWERVLCRAGPVRLAPDVGVDVRHVAACRVQGVWRAWRRDVGVVWTSGAQVWMRFPGQTWERGKLVQLADTPRGWCVRRLEASKHSFVFLPHQRVVLRRAERADRRPRHTLAASSPSARSG